MHDVNLGLVAQALNSTLRGCETSEELMKARDVMRTVILDIENRCFGGIGRGPEFREIVYRGVPDPRGIAYLADRDDDEEDDEEGGAVTASPLVASLMRRISALEKAHYTLTCTVIDEGERLDDVIEGRKFPRMQRIVWKKEGE